MLTIAGEVCAALLPRFLGATLLVAISLTAQVPTAHPNRKVHPSIAAPAPGLVAASAPLIAIQDGVWNHGEGFGTAFADHGGWHDTTDGTNLTRFDVHVRPSDIWVPFTWRSDQHDLHPASPHQMLRMEG